MAEKNNQGIELVKAGVNVLGQFYLDLAQPSVKALGQALAIVFELCPNSLLSLRLWTEKRKSNFAKRLNEYKDKLEQIPEEKRCEVETQIGTPIVERLTYTTNDEIADLFTTLLANASNIDTVNRAHPAFIDIIGRMTPDEARILSALKGESYLPFCEIRAKSANGYTIIESHLTALRFDLKLDFPKNVGAYLSNLTSLGIFRANNDMWIQLNTEDYDRMCKLYDLEEIKKTLVPDICEDVITKRDFLTVTPFGKLFIQACIKD